MRTSPRKYKVIRPDAPNGEVVSTIVDAWDAKAAKIVAMLKHPILTGPSRGNQDRTWLSNAIVEEYPNDPSGVTWQHAPAGTTQVASNADGSPGVTGEDLFESERGSPSPKRLLSECDFCGTEFPEDMLRTVMEKDSEGTLLLASYCPDHAPVEKKSEGY